MNLYRTLLTAALCASLVSAYADPASAGWKRWRNNHNGGGTTSGGTTTGGTTTGGTTTGGTTTGGTTTGGTTTGGTTTGGTTTGGTTTGVIPAFPKTATWHVQLDGTPIYPNVEIIDMDATNLTASTIATLHGQGKKVVCYFSAGTYENWRADSTQFPPAAVGLPLDDWPGEKWLDIRNPGVMTVQKARMDMAKSKGCDAVDPDNVDGYTYGVAKTGFNFTKQDQINYLNALADYAHSKGMAIGLKNALEIAGDVVAKFDFAINESCLSYSECNMYAPFKNANKLIMGIDYTGYSASKCTTAKNNGVSMRFYDSLLKTAGTACPAL